MRNPTVPSSFKFLAIASLNVRFLNPTELATTLISNPEFVSTFRINQFLVPSSLATTI